MYSKEDRELALMALSEGWTQAEAAGLVGCARTTVGHWAAGHASRKEPAYLPYDGKRGLAARLPAGERAEDLASEGGVSAAAVRGWARRLAEEGELALMSDEDARVRSPEPAGPPAELEALRRRCEELELENAILAGTVEILKKDPGADPSALTAAERAALAASLGGRFGLARVLGALSLPRSTFYYGAAASSAPDPYAAPRPLVRASFGASGGACGPRRVWSDLRSGPGEPRRARGAASLDPSRPVVVSEKVVRRVVREEGPGRPLLGLGGPALQLLRRRGGPALRPEPPARRRGARPARLLGAPARRGDRHRRHGVPPPPTTRGRSTCRRRSTPSAGTWPPSPWG